MGKFVKGDIVVIPFPFSDLSGSKKRPALVLADLAGDDIILCQITSQINKDSYSIFLEDSDFKTFKLPAPSNIRPNRIFTADKRIILKKAASLKDEVLDKVVRKVVEIISA